MPTRIAEPIRLYDGPAPGSDDWTHEEQTYWAELFETDIVANVVDPSIIPVIPDHPNGAAMLIAPGGGYHALSINTEGHWVASWLAERGITAFILKYRLIRTDGDAAAAMFEKVAADRSAAEAEMHAMGELAGADAEAAMRLIRSRAADYGIDPGRVGAVGFSAGGNVAVRLAFTDDDAARPNAVAPIYASVRQYELTEPPAGSGPMFLSVAADDQLGLTNDSLELYRCWHGAGLSVELHAYARGGHGFGMRDQGLPSDTWIDRFGDWLADIGLVDTK